MNENQVIETLKQHLSARGYAFVSECCTTKQGIDLVMRKDNQELWIEAKGATGARKGSNRFGMNFNDQQCNDHYSRAFFKVCQMRDKSKETGEPIRIAMAFAHTKHYQKYFDRTDETRKELGIAVY